MQGHHIPQASAAIFYVAKSCGIRLYWACITFKIQSMLATIGFVSVQILLTLPISLTGLTRTMGILKIAKSFAQSIVSLLTGQLAGGDHLKWRVTINGSCILHPEFAIEVFFLEL